MSAKKTERVTVWLPESLNVELMRLASDDDRKHSEFIANVLSLYVYGHSRKCRADSHMANSGDSES